MAADPTLYPSADDNEIETLRKIGWLFVQQLWASAPPPSPDWMPQLTDDALMHLRRINGALLSSFRQG